MTEPDAGRDAEPQTDHSSSPQSTDPENTKLHRQRWYSRPTLRAIIRKETESFAQWAQDRDEKENAETRLPEIESVHLGGFALTEAFTPSTVSELYKALERWPTNQPSRRQEWLDELTRSRRGAHGGWRSLGVVRQQGQPIFGDGHNDSELPEGVDAVWLHLYYITQSIAIVVATFTLSEEAGDLSMLLRDDYHSYAKDVEVKVFGRFGRFRKNIPWSRPAQHPGVGYSMTNVQSLKTEAVDRFIEQHQGRCQQWFTEKFPGRFAATISSSRPTIRLLFTRGAIPFQPGSPAWLRPTGLSGRSSIWQSEQPPGWALDLRPHAGTENTIMVAARRTDISSNETTSNDNESLWILTQDFGRHQSELAMWQALIALLSTYSNRIGDLRDRAGAKRRVSRPVQEAVRLDQQLIGDGLDAATITSDILELTGRSRITYWNISEYVEDFTRYPETFHKNPPRKLTELFRNTLQEQAERLSRDTDATTASIRASAELRQSISNTRLQRMTMFLSLIAVVVAVVSR